MKIATWNVNSLRVRLPQVLSWLEEEKPDILALQETKVQNSDFPAFALSEIGYYVSYSGQKAYNGVALITCHPPKDLITDPPTLQDPQRRCCAVTVHGWRLINLYVPNGEEVGTEKYRYKLEWLARIQIWLEQELKRYPYMVVLGDFNIAPEDHDVYAPEKWYEKILCSTPERQAFKTLLETGLIDIASDGRISERGFTWWSYQANSFKRNWGLRIDHILASPSVHGLCLRCYVDTKIRGAERPSDHAPVVAEFHSV